MFTEIRRKDRILENELVYRLLESGEYGFLAMEGVNGYGYGIPISYILNDKCIGTILIKLIPGNSPGLTLS